MTATEQWLQRVESARRLTAAYVGHGMLGAVVSNAIVSELKAVAIGVRDHLEAMVGTEEFERDRKRLCDAMLGLKAEFSQLNEMLRRAARATKEGE